MIGSAEMQPSELKKCCEAQLLHVCTKSHRVQPFTAMLKIECSLISIKLVLNTYVHASLKRHARDILRPCVSVRDASNSGVP